MSVWLEVSIFSAASSIFDSTLDKPNVVSSPFGDETDDLPVGFGFSSLTIPARPGNAFLKMSLPKLRTEPPTDSVIDLVSCFNSLTTSGSSEPKPFLF